jgi:hypothetical protein
MKRYPIKVDYGCVIENALCKFQCIMREVIVSTTQEAQSSLNTVDLQHSWGMQGLF